ncbi:MAG: SRPBCC domain-containing protein [Chloroflexota bacterium]
MGFKFLDGEIGEITRTDAHTYDIHTEVVIDAPPETVWGVLTDFDRLAEWSNNFIGLEGDFKDGGQVTVEFKTLGEHSTTLDHELKFFEEGRSFGWSDPLLPGIADRHLYQVNPTDDGKTQFVQNDQVHGHMAPIIGHQLAKATMQSYVLFNRALKERAEAMA